MTDGPQLVCECRHTLRQHWTWMDDDNGWSGSPCMACNCPDFEERSMTCAYCGDRKYLRDFLVPYEAVCRDCLPPS